MKATIAALLILLAADSPAPAQPAGTIDLAAANRMLDSYTRHALSKLPRDWRKVEEERMRESPPHIDADGIYQIMVPEGMIGFEYDAESQRLLCYAVIPKPRQEMTLWGLDRHGLQTALDRAVAAGVDTGGGELIWDDEAKGFFLRRAFSEEPRTTRRMIREMDRLLAAGERWFRKHYLEAVKAHVETLAPPASATGRDGELEVTILLTHDKRYQDLWRKPPGHRQPHLVSRREFAPGEEVWALALFRGAAADEQGLFRFKAQYTFVYPDGIPHGSPVGNLWWSEPPPAGHLQMSELRAAIEISDATPPGDYVAAIKACDPSLERCVTAETPFRVVAGRQ